MITYLLLNSLFLIVLIAVFKPSKPSAITWKTLGLLLLLTAVFDNVIIGLHIVAYDHTKLLGWYIGRAPVEDFMYSLAAVLVVPRIWQLCASRSHE